MEFKEILAVSGQPGLFKFVAQAKNGIIVESLLTGARSTVASTAKVSALAEIAIYTETDEVALSEVFEKIYKLTGGKETVSPKSTPEELKKFFAQALPEFDRDRVHVSDIRKVAAWYNALVGAGMTEFKVEEEAVEEAAPEAPAAKKTASEKPAAKKTTGAKASEKKVATPKPATAKKPATQKTGSKRGA